MEQQDLIGGLTNRLFETLPHSARTEQARAAVEAALRTEYARLRTSEKYGALRATGELLIRYGTLEAAGALAGFPPEEISAWRETGSLLDRRAFARLFRGRRLLIYLCAAGLAAAAGTLLSMACMWQPSTLITLGVSMLVSLAGGLPLLRAEKRRQAQPCAFTPEALALWQAESDRYAKRQLNSVFLIIGAIAYAVHITGMLGLTAGKAGAQFAQILYHQTELEACCFLLLKNLLCRRALAAFFPDPRRAGFARAQRRLALAAAGYWAAVLTALMLLRSRIEFYFNAFLAAAVLYALLCLLYNLTRRRRLVGRNVVFNRRRCAVFGAAILLFGVYSAMRMDHWLLLPYISQVAAVDRAPDDIVSDDATGVYTITTDKEEFRILQLTDIHLGGSVSSAVKDYKALDACNRLIQAARPDLVVVTGDLVFPLGVMSFSLNNTAPITEFAAFMRNTGVPWAFTYGNHDTENMATGSAAAVAELFRSLSFHTSRNLLYPYAQPAVTGRSNQLIEIRNRGGGLRQALFLLDSNDYTGEGVNAYDCIHDDQVDWYAAEVRRLDAAEGRVVPSMLFFHIPLQQYKTAYELYAAGSPQVRYFFGENGETMIDKVCCSRLPSRLFDTARALGSTGAMFCGHDHYNNLSVEYQGIRLTYGMSIDYLAMPGISRDTGQRGGTLIRIAADGSWKIEQMPLNSLAH